MPTLVLAFDEIMFLSALAPTKPGHNYPLQHLLGREGAAPPEEIKKIYSHFVESGLILLDREGAPHLNGELAVVFSILNRPEECLYIHAFARPETPYYALCGRSGRWVILTFGKEDSFFAVSYLFNYENLAKWFSFDLLGREEFAEPFFPEKNIRLTSLELSLLAVMQGIYKGRVEMKGARLEKEEQLISWEELWGRENAKYAQKVLPYELDGDKFAALFADHDLIQTTAESLAEKDIIEFKARGAAFTSLAKDIFDPGKVRNMLICTKPGLINQPRTLQVYAGGWLILRPVMGERGQVELKLLPGSISGVEIFQHILGRAAEEMPSPTAAIEEAAARQPAGAAAAREEGWYLYLQKQQYGPYSWRQLRQFAREGRLTMESLVWHSTLSGWQQAAEIEGLFQEH